MMIYFYDFIDLVRLSIKILWLIFLVISIRDHSEGHQKIHFKDGIIVRSIHVNSLDYMVYNLFISLIYIETYRIVRGR